MRNSQDIAIDMIIEDMQANTRARRQRYAALWLAALAARMVHRGQ